MKKRVFSILLTVAGMEAQAQQPKTTIPPEKVQFSFIEKYPRVQRAKWDKEGHDYEAHFEQNQVPYAVLFSKTGLVLETEIGIHPDALSGQIKQYITKHHPGKNITAAFRIVDQHGKVTYEAEVDGEDLLFDAKGIFLKKD